MKTMKLVSSALPFVFDCLRDSTEWTAAHQLDKVGIASLLTGHAGAEPRPARVSAAGRFRRGEENQRAGKGKVRRRASLGVCGAKEKLREGLGGGHDVDSGMPSTQLCAWLPEEYDRSGEVGLAGWAFAWGDR